MFLFYFLALNMRQLILYIRLLLTYNIKELIFLFIFIFSINFSKAQLIVEAGRDQVVCSGDSVIIGGTPTATGGTGTYTYSWYPSTGLTNTSASNPYAKPIIDTKYTVKVTSGGLTATDNVMVYVATQNGAISGLASKYCFSNPAVTLTGNPIGGTFSGPGILTVLGVTTFTPSVAGIGSKTITYDYVENPWIIITSFQDDFSTDKGWTGYDVGALDSGGWERKAINPNIAIACVGSAQPPDDATLTSNDSIVLGTFINSCYNLNIPQTYYITSPVINCSNLTNVTIQFAQSSSFSTFLDTFSVEVLGTDNLWHKMSKVAVNNFGWSFPSFNNVTYADNNSNFRVRFGIGPTNATNKYKGWRIDDFKVSGTFTATCNNQSTASTYVWADVNPDAGANKTICVNDSVQLTAKNLAGGTSTYSWAPSSTLSNKDTISPWAKPTITTTYRVTITNAGGCSAFDSVIVTVNPLPNISIAPSNATICEGNSITLTASGAGFKGTYTWNNGLDTGAIQTVSPTINTTYRVTGKDTKGCANVASSRITVNALPIITATVDKDTICKNDTVQLTASGGASVKYTWSNGASGAIVKNVIPTSTVTYIVTARDTITSCTTTASVKVFVNPLPNITITATKDEICINTDSSRLTASGATSYIWSNSLGSGASKYVKPIINTTYTVTGTDANACKNTASYIIKVNPLPTVGISVTKTAICKNDTLHLTGTGANTYAWNNPSSFVNPKIVNPTTTTAYTVTGTDVKGCTNTSSITITVNALPNVTASASPNPICKGDSTTLTGGGAVSYIWDIILGTGSKVAPTITTTYKVTGTNINGCTNTATITVTVNPIPIANAGADATICKGDSTILNASGGTSYSWSPTNGLNFANIANPKASPSITTTYIVKVTSFGCTATDNVVVTVNNLPVVIISSDKNNVCPATAVKLTASAAKTYVWGHTVDTSSIQNVNPNSTSTYKVTGTDANTCSNTASIIISVYPAATTTVTANRTAICKGDTTRLKASGGITYAWIPRNSLNDTTVSNPIASPTTTTNYLVTVTNSNGCTVTGNVSVAVNTPPVGSAGADVTICQGNSTTFNAFGGTSYSWSPSTGLSATNISNPTANPATNTTYIVKITNGFGCSATDDVVVTVNNLPSVIISSDKNNVCPATTVKLTASGAKTYIWGHTADISSIQNVNPNSTSTYKVTGTDVNTCSNTASIIISVYPAATTTVTANRTAICKGDTTRLKATNGGTYIWLPNDGTLNNINIATPIASPTTTTNYLVTVTNSNGCTVTGNVSVTVNTPPVGGAGADVTICQGNSTTLSAFGGTSYSWSPATALSAINIYDPIANPATNTTYIVTITNGFGCSATDDVVVTVNPLPVITITGGGSICPEGNTNINATYAGATNYIWSPSTGLSNANIANPIATPTVSTNYSVTVTDANGCKGSKSVVVNLYPVATTIVTANRYSVCGDTTMLKATNGVTYTWFPNDGTLNNINSATPIASPTITTNYFVTVTNSNGCTVTGSVNIIVSAPPTVEAGSDVSICTGASIQFNATSNGTTFSWTPTATIVSGVNTLTPTVTPPSTTKYIIYATSGACISKDSLVVYVNPLIINASDDQTICKGNSITLNVYGADNYIWTGGYTNSSITVTPLTTTTYNITGTKGTCIATEQIIVTVNSLNLSISGLDAEYCQNAPSVVVKGQHSGGVFYGPGIINDSIFSPELAGVGTHTITYVNSDTFTVVSNFFFDDFSTKTKGWSGYGEGGWDIAPVSTGSICDGTYQNPTQDYSPFTSDNGILGTYINSCYENNLTKKYFLSPWINCLDYEEVKISFYSNSAFESSNDAAVLEVFKGNWQTIYSNQTTPIQENSWTLKTFDVSTYADKNTLFRIQFGIGSTDASGTYKGWRIDDFSIVGKKQLICYDSVTQVVTVNALPIPEAGADQTICKGNSTTLSTTGGITYSWSSGVNTQSTIVLPLTDSLFYVTVTDNNCSAKDSVLVSVAELPIANAGVDQTICYGDSTQVTASGGINYQWSDGQTGNPVYFKPNITTTYTLTVNDGLCSSTDELIITVDSFYTKINISDDTICFGGSINLSVDTGISFIWTPQNGSLSDSSAQNTMAMPLNTTTYYVTVTNALACIATDTAIIVVNSLPVLTISNDTTICSKDTITITASGADTYLWSTGANSQSIKIPVNNTSYIYVTGYYDNGCYSKDSILITTLTLPLADAGWDRTICKGDSIFLAGFGGTTYSWSSGEDTAIIRISPPYSTTYILTVSDGICKNYDTVVVTVDSVDAKIYTSKDTICFGDSLQLSATGGITYLWTPQNGSLSDSSASNPIATPQVSTTYSVIIAGANTCVANLSIPITVHTLPIADAGSNITICKGDTATLTATGGKTYSWSTTEAIPVIKVTPTDSIMYYVNVTDSNSCSNIDSVFVTVNLAPSISVGADKSICKNDSILLVVASAPNYLWNTGEIKDSIYVQPDTTTIYTVIGIENNCSAYDTIVVMVDSITTKITADKTTICLGDSINLTATNGTTYTWSPNDLTLNDINIAKPVAKPTINITYSVSITGSNSCTATDEIAIIINPLPTADAGIDKTICLNDTVVLTASGAIDYLWANNSSIISGLDTATITILPNITDQYIVTVTDINGCSDADSVVVTVNPLPSINITGISTICNFDSSLLTVTGGTTYSWFASEIISNNTNDSILVKPSTDTKYLVSVIDTNTCSNIDSIEIKVNALPNVIANALPDTICYGTTTIISVTGAKTYLWDDVNLGNIENLEILPTVSATYIVTGTDDNNCTNIDTIEVVVNPLPVVEIIADTNYICRGVTLTLKGTNADSYFWSTAETTDSIIVAPTASIIYAITGTDANGCSATDDFVLNVFQLPDVTIDRLVNEVCIGSSITLSALGANTYTWDDNVGTTANVIVAPTTKTLYTVTGYDSNGCSDMDTMSVNVNPLPVIDAGPSGTICIGDSVQLHAFGGVIFKWDNSSSLNKDIYFNPWAKPTINTTYTVTITNSKGCSDTDVTDVTVNPLPIVTVSPDKEICMNSSTPIFATGGSTYTWFPKEAINDFTKDTAIVSPTVSVYYSVTVKDNNGCSETNRVFITVNPLPDVNVTQDKTIICLGDSAILTASGATNYTWSNGSTLAQIIVSPTDTIIYFVEGTDNKGCKGYDTVTVAVNQIPVADAGIDREICFGDTVTIKANYGMDLYNWTSGDNTKNSTVKPSSTETYILTVTKDGCTDTDDVIVTVYDNPILIVSGDQSLCFNDSVTITATGGNAYYWNTGDSIASITVKPAYTTTYYVTTQNQYNCTANDSVIVSINPLPTVNVTSDKSICIGQTVSLSASGADLYSWEPASSLDDNHSATPIASPTGTTTYTLTLTNNTGNCTATAQVVVNVFEYPNITYSNDTNICRGSVISLWASGGDSYKWSNGASDSAITIGDTASIIYAVTVSKNGCEKSGAIVVSVFQIPNIDAGTDTSLCIGDTIMLIATSSSVMNTYTWDNQQSINDSTITTPLVFPTNNTIYRLTTTDINGCSASDYITVIVNAIPVIKTDNLVYLCLNDSVNINVTGANYYTWDNGKTSNSIYVNPTENTTYKVTATDINGCSATDEVNIIINGLPTANAGEDRTICKNESISLLASGGETYYWSTSDTGKFINVTPSISIIYEVTVFDANGCSDMDTVGVRVIVPKVTMKTTDASICLNDSLYLFASGGDNYIWDNGDYDSIIHVSPDTTTKYFVTVSLYGCSTMDSINVSVNMLPTISIAKGIDTAICYGKKVNLIANGGVSYIWNNASTNDTLVVNPKFDTYYTITAKDINGCSGTDDIWVYINNLPVISAGEDISICQGSFEYLNLSGFNMGDVFKWNTAKTLSDSTIPYPLASPTVNTTYTVTVTDVNKCSASDNVVVTVLSLPTITVSKNDTICIYDSTNIIANSTTAAYYSWYPSTGLSYNNVKNPNTAPTSNTTYTVEVTDTNGCINTKSLSIKINPLPIVNAGNDTAICYGNNIKIYSSFGVKYKWLPQAGLSNDTVYNPNAFPMITTTYIVTVTDSNGCSNTDDIILKVNDLPLAFAGNDTMICNGTNILLNAVGGINYYWSPANSIDNDSIQNPLATPTITTTYIVTVVNTNNCSAADDIVVSLPVAKAQDDVTVCYNQEVIISATGGLSYSWSNGNMKDSIVIKETIDAYYTVTINDNICISIDTVFVKVNPLPVAYAGKDTSICFGATTSLVGSGGEYYYWSNQYDTAYMEVYPTITTTYTLTVIDNNNCSNTDDVVVFINPLPIVNAGNDLSICVGDTLNKGTITATGGLTYSWIPNTDIIDENTDSPILFPKNNKAYAVYATDVNGCVNNDTLVVFVNPLPFINLGFDTLICFGDTVKIKNKSAQATDTYLWSDNSTNAVLTISPEDTTQYTVTITDINGCFNSAQKTVKVLPVPFVDAGMDSAICFNKSIYLNGQGGVKYKWTPSLGLNNDSIPYPIATPLITTTYTLSITNYYKCTAIDSVVITVHPNPNSIVTGKQIICLQDIDTIIVTGASSYEWHTGDKNDTIIVSPKYNTKYIVTSQNEFGCVDIDSITVKVNPLPYTAMYSNYDTICSNNELILAAYGGFAYVWSEQGLTGQMIAFNPQTITDEYKQYIVTVTDTNICSITDTVNIFVKKAPIADAGTDFTTCFNALPVILDASASTHLGNTIIWSNGGYDTKTLVAPKVTTSYTLTIKSPNGCLDVDTVIVNVHDVVKPIITAKDNKTGFCDNTLNTNPVDVTLSLTVEPNYASYTWNNSSSTQTINVNDPGYYFITVIDNNNCVLISDSIEVKVFKTESPLVISDKPNNTACQNDTLMLFIDNDPDFNKYLSYVWSSGSVAPYIKVTQPKSFYDVTVTDRNGCVIIVDGVNVTLNPVPISSFTFKNTGRTLQFENLSSNADSYYWDFGDTQTSSETNPEHIFSQDGEYKIMLIATNQCASVSEYITIEVLEYNSIEELDILNAFAIYPNPAQNIINVSFKSSFNGNIFISNILGETINTKQNISTQNNNTKAIDVSKLSPGIYFINIESNNTVAKRKFIKQ